MQIHNKRSWQEPVSPVDSFHFMRAVLLTWLLLLIASTTFRLVFSFCPLFFCRASSFLFFWPLLSFLFCHCSSFILPLAIYFPSPSPFFFSLRLLFLYAGYSFELRSYLSDRHEVDIFIDSSAPLLQAILQWCNKVCTTLLHSLHTIRYTVGLQIAFVILHSLWTRTGTSIPSFFSSLFRSFRLVVCIGLSHPRCG